MTDKELDKLFQQSFAAHELPVPEDMWQRVNPQKKKRRVAFWWWSGLGAAALLVAGAFAWWSAVPSSSKTSADHITASAKNKSKQSAVVAGGQLKKKSLSDAVITHQNQGALKVAPADEYAGFQHDQSLFISSKKKIKQAGNKTIIRDELRSNTEQIQPENSGQKSGEFLSLQNKKADELNSAENNKNNEVPILQDALKPADSAASAETGKAIKVDSVTSETKASTVKVHLPKRNKTAIEWMVAGYAGDRAVYNVQKQASAFFVSPDNPQIKTFVHSYSLNMRVEKPISRHWSVKTGLQFLQTHQSITYNAESVNRYAVVNALSVSSDTTRFTEINVKRPQIKSIFNSLSIPLHVSYHTDGKKINLGVSGGVLVNVFSWYKGEVPDGNYRNKIDAGKAFRRNSGSALYLSLPVAKSFGNWQLFAEPQVQYSLSSLTKKSVSFRQRITYYGLGIGIKKSIGK